jgi:hypothetical protein
MFTGSPSVSWSYNWADAVGGESYGLEFVPMMWGPGQADTFAAAVETAIGLGSKHILGINEPDQAGQNLMLPSELVTIWQNNMNQWNGKIKVGGPAVTNGVVSDSGIMGLPYLKEFYDACTGCVIDFQPIHWYGTELSQLETQIDNAATQTGKPIWVTEWGFTANATPENMAAALAMMDAKSTVERYAYFMAAPNILLNSAGNGLSELGTAYL